MDKDENSNLLYNITENLVCNQCYEEYCAGLTDSSSLQQYSMLDVGLTDIGLQVWCRRHNVNVVHVDFGGNKLEADFRSLSKLHSD